MKTLYLNSNNQNDIEKAAVILKNGGLVAIPTETVYGLAANALDPQAVGKIFAAKGRPQDNPLIVHVSCVEEIFPLVEAVDERLFALADRFWPGPLTVIMKKSALIPDEVSAGLDTVAIRIPSHPAARKVISEAGFPLAAPSANSSGKPSPTTANHVRMDLDGKIDAVLDGGRSGVGVESTVITLVTSPPTLLRPGGVTVEELTEVLGETAVSSAVFEKLKDGEKAQSPGMKYKHYAPCAQVTIIKGSFEQYKKFLLAQKDEVCAVCFEGEGRHFKEYIEYGNEKNGSSQAYGIFDALRRIDELGCKRAFVRCPSTDGVGLAVYNRLLRAAAFRVIDLEMKLPVVGLTGQTGAGKSTVCRLLEQRGCYIADTDVLARKATEEPEVISKLTEIFGNDIVKNGVLDRREVARRAFSDPEKTKLLNSVTHPVITRLVIAEIHRAERLGAVAAVIDAPVLFESCIPAFCDLIVCVTADEDIRLKRIIERDGIDRQDALIRMNAQRDAEYYIERSDIIIKNNGSDSEYPDIESVIRKVGELKK